VGANATDTATIDQGVIDQAEVGTDSLGSFTKLAQHIAIFADLNKTLQDARCRGDETLPVGIIRVDSALNTAVTLIATMHRNLSIGGNSLTS
jgi:hypothetical protein